MEENQNQNEEKEKLISTLEEAFTEYDTSEPCPELMPYLNEPSERVKRLIKMMGEAVRELED